MKMHEVAKSNNDEYYTPLYAIEPICEYIKPNSTIWCPFDIEESLYVKHLKEIGHTVINTHIANGEDFFNIDVPKCDYIISNPPFSKKIQVLERLFEIGIPFAMLVGDLGLFASKKKYEMFKNNKFELLYLDKRVSYFNDSIGDKMNPPFSSIYVCSNMLPNQINFKEITKG